MAMPRLKIKTLHHRHSGRLRPHEYTSYFPLVVLLLLVGIALTVSSVWALDPPPQPGSIGLSGIMPGTPPKIAAVINSPASGQHVSASPVTISGTCPKNTLVEIYKNDIFAGSATCSDGGTFSFGVDLLIGQNTLIARVYDALNQPGPDSAPVTVFYDALPFQGSSLVPLNFSDQLLLNTDTVFRGVFPNHELSVPIDIVGGTPPYAVNVQWGDSTNKIVPRNDNLAFNVTHTYTKPGVYQITFQATDVQNRTAFLTVAAIVNGQPSVSLVASSTKPMNKLLVLWPLYTTALAMVISFWLGERREKRLIGEPPSPTLRLHPQT
jgi:hypothetical protein